ncbi:MAG TPA: hypothetical protein VE242_04950 [Chthoniobacterales bacterium]|nr:hypothetical protein [Chthoniobacterales bacterium]
MNVKTTFLNTLYIPLGMCALAALTNRANAHGFAGDRFFPATISTDDPFAASELSLPTVSFIRLPSGNGPVKVTDVSADLAVVVLPRISVTFGDGYQIAKPANHRALTGFDNAHANVLFEFYENDPHELITSVGLTWEIGGTGRRSIGASSFSTFTPTFYFGKGLGDLPSSLPFLRPFALTGVAGLAIPARAADRSVSVDPTTGQNKVTVSPNPDLLQWGIALEYSIIYLQEHVKDVGLRAPFDRLIPLVEFAMQTPVNRLLGPTTGTVNPGVIWSGRYCQFGIEAIIPVNSHTGNNLGVVGQLHFYLDDILPKVFGKPLINP